MAWPACCSFLVSGRVAVSAREVAIARRAEGLNKCCANDCFGGVFRPFLPRGGEAGPVSKASCGGAPPDPRPQAGRPAGNRASNKRWTGARDDRDQESARRAGVARYRVREHADSGSDPPRRARERELQSRVSGYTVSDSQLAYLGRWQDSAGASCTRLEREQATPPGGTPMTSAHEPVSL